MTAKLTYANGEWSTLELNGATLTVDDIIAIEIVADETTMFHPLARITVPVDLDTADVETIVEGGATLDDVADYIAGLDADLIDELAVAGLGLSDNYTARLLELVSDMIRSGGS